MRFLAVDDEKIMLNKLIGVLKSVRPEAEILQFTWADDALRAAKERHIDAAFLDIQMGGMTGLQLAAHLKKIQPKMHIIFITGHHGYALDAFKIRATGYLLKPVSEEAVRRELTFIYEETESQSRIRVKTFGGFDIFVEGSMVKFNRTKAKELLAFLVDRRGLSVTTGEAYAALFEDYENTRSGKAYFRTILHEMIKALKQADAEEILLIEHNSFAVVPERFDCDFYRFLEGDPIAVNLYQNDYMPAYSWAEVRNAELGFRAL